MPSRTEAALAVCGIAATPSRQSSRQSGGRGFHHYRAEVVVRCRKTVSGPTDYAVGGGGHRVDITGLNAQT